MAAPLPIRDRKWTGRHISDIAGEKIYVACDRCRIIRQYDATEMLARLDEDLPMTMVLDRLKVAYGCEVHTRSSAYFDEKCQLKFESARMPYMWAQKKSPEAG